MSIFWTEKIRDSLSNLSCDVSLEKRLNSVTVLCLGTGAFLYALKNEYWLYFTIATLLVIILAYYMMIRQREQFSLVPTYSGTDFMQTVVSPTYAEEWQIPPPAYDLYTRIPPQQTFQQPLRPQSYPYGQYLTTTNLLPSDEYYVRNQVGGLKQAREYVNSTYLRHDLAHRENISRIFKKKLQRRFRSNAYNDTVSPYYSY
ncbi:MAG TPA: hypothetical protein VLE02_00925 [Nitrosarchaeum sp.]|nr:hypothetical protein [Nitrosarchaeum sp.]